VKPCCILGLLAVVAVVVLLWREPGQPEVES
jgi:hypothetical protein